MDKLPPKAFIAIDTRITQLANNPRPVGSIKLKDAIYRIRIGDYRIIYGIDDANKLIIVSRVKLRNERTYKDYY